MKMILHLLPTQTRRFSEYGILYLLGYFRVTVTLIGTINVICLHSGYLSWPFDWLDFLPPHSPETAFYMVDIYGEVTNVLS